MEVFQERLFYVLGVERVSSVMCVSVVFAVKFYGLKLTKRIHQNIYKDNREELLCARTEELGFAITYISN